MKRGMQNQLLSSTAQSAVFARTRYAPMQFQQHADSLLLRSYVNRVAIYAALARLFIVVLFQVTNIHVSLRLSPDSEYYHRTAIQINRDINSGIEPDRAWVDQGWFRFTALVYRYAGNLPWVIQLFNVAASVLTIYVAASLAWRTTGDKFVVKITALIVGFFPSFIYWSCLMLKDPIAILAVTTIVNSVVAMRHTVSIKHLAFAIVSMIALLGVRDYMFFVTLWCSCASLLLFPQRVRSQLAGLVMIAVLIAIPFVLGFGVAGIDFVNSSRYFDVDYINHVRVAMGDHGTGALFEPDKIGQWGDDYWQNLINALKGVFFLVFVIDLTDVDGVRQLIAFPEAVAVIFLLPTMFKGIKYMWRNRRIAAPILVFTSVIAIVYLSATTNMGALFRWKMQIMPMLSIIIGSGMAHHSKGEVFKIAMYFVHRFEPRNQSRIFR
jgi:hypothetical protein